MCFLMMPFLFYELNDTQQRQRCISLLLPPPARDCSCPPSRSLPSFITRTFSLVMTRLLFCKTYFPGVSRQARTYHTRQHFDGSHLRTNPSESLQGKLFLEEAQHIPRIIKHLKGGYSPSVQYYREKHVLLCMTQKQLTHISSHICSLQ